jgi:bifunctional non-homologous end joining protein LigD
MSLQEYTRKRDVMKAAEPLAKRGGANRYRFVVQKHSAKRLHYELRLERKGVLKSWILPKGVPLIKGEKHLAIAIEDCPISYLHFEGTIPEEADGGGAVMVWDHGNYEADEVPPNDLADGKFHFRLNGVKLQGEWYLVKLRETDNQWLLIRAGKDLWPLENEDASSLSGKSMQQLAVSSAPKRGANARSSVSR